VIANGLLKKKKKKKYTIDIKAAGQGAGSRGRESRSEVQKVDNLFFGVP
jgi:hypothetical protein